MDTLIDPGLQATFEGLSQDFVDMSEEREADAVKYTLDVKAMQARER